MTQYSYVWDGTVTGDASLAPYDAIEFNKYLHMSVAEQNNASNTGVIAGYAGDLQPQWAGEGVDAVIVRSGAAVIKNILYILDEDLTISIDRPTSGQVRDDYLVLRYATINYADQKANTVRLAVVKGPERGRLSNTALPALTQTSAIWESPIAAVYANSDPTYPNATNTVVGEGDVRDLREFVYNTASSAEYNAPMNMLRSGEWMALGTTFPEGWFPYNSGTFFYDVEAFADIQSSIRGLALLTNTPASIAKEGMYQVLNAGGRTFTMRGGVLRGSSYSPVLIEVEAYRSDGSYIETYAQKFHYYNGSLYYRFTMTFSENVRYLKVLITEEGTTAEYKLHDHHLYAGYLATFDDRPMVIQPYHTNIAITGWTGGAKSSGTTTITLYPSVAKLPIAAKAYMLRLRARDSGSAAGTNIYLRIEPAPGYVAGVTTNANLTLYLDGAGNDDWREMTVIVPIDRYMHRNGSLTQQMDAVVSASGAGTLDATIEVRGVLA